MMKKILLSIFFVLFLLTLKAQDDGAGNGAREGNFFAFGISYGLNFPMADLSDRFGTSFQAGMSADWFDDRINSAYGLEGFLLFGDNVKEDVVSSLRLDNSAILGFDGRYADVFLRFRGFYSGVYFKKMILGLPSNRRSGLALTLGAGYLQHKVRIQVDTNNAPNLEGEYKKGYDRHTMGPALKQGISYTHVGKSSGVNFAFSLHVIEGFTKNQRIINFDTLEKETDARLDLILGLNFKWFIPLVDTREAENIYY